MLYVCVCVWAGAMSMGKGMVKDLLQAFPGIDEAMSYAEVMK